MAQLNFKENGMAFAAQSHELELMACRDMAEKIAAQKGSVTIDDLRLWMPKMEFGNWAGSIFKDPRFVPKGFVPATHTESHGRIIREWTLKK